ncbi:hypothetical protein SAMN05878482_1112 [Peribacillus simplex]|uniref:Uncharacterized protein n=1 Tax=Peribacillus simplex TaxID=1478 RepID=A0A9X8WN16_9BACI|nr:hypothetical protein [Peribacillus simplex]SIS05391.1 hypothetical protein SAMN05878482_1112 [Peribacillus simplex]
MTDSESKLTEENDDKKLHKLVGSMEYTEAQLLEGMNGISEVYLKNSEEGTSETSDK